MTVILHAWLMLLITLDKVTDRGLRNSEMWGGGGGG